MNGLIIGSEPTRKILSGQKTWEIRSKRTNLRGCIALIRKGSKKIVGICKLDRVEGPFALDELSRHEDKHRASYESLKNRKYEQYYAWVLVDIKPLKEEMDYDHPNGAVTWVDLSNHPRLRELEDCS